MSYDPTDWRYPAKMGLYDPSLEHDACGVGFIVDIEGKQRFTGKKIGVNQPYWEEKILILPMRKFDQILQIFNETYKKYLCMDNFGYE